MSSVWWRLVQLMLVANIVEPLHPTAQHQLSLAAYDDNGADEPPHYYVEFDDASGFANAAVTFFDGSAYTQEQRQTLVTDVHAGLVTLQATEVDNTSITLDGGWGGSDEYHLVEN